MKIKLSIRSFESPKLISIIMFGSERQYNLYVNGDPIEESQKNS